MNNNAVPTPIIGKIIGGVVGTIFFGPIGLIIGILIGHFFDRRASGYFPFSKAERGLVFDASFQLMGYIAKADGQISQAEINFAQQAMRRMRLNSEQREQAMRLFYEGKERSFNLDSVLSRMREEIGGRHRVALQRFLNLLVQMAYVEGAAKPEVQSKLQYIASQLNMNNINFAYYDAIFAWQERYQRGGGWQQSQQQYQQQQGGRAYQRPNFSNINDAYTILGVSADASEADIKKAYRRKMSQYHPDKLMSKGLTEKEMEAATEKVQRIKAAYEQIKQSKGF